jgi:hypothetical protein
MSLQVGVNNNYYGGTPSRASSTSTVLVRVDKVILGPLDSNGQPDIDFNANGKWASIGSILYTPILNNPQTITGVNPIARPYNSSLKQFPLIGEIVQLVPGPSPKLNDSITERDLYYLPPYNLWNNAHHNSFPNLLNYSKSTSTHAVSYTDTTNGIAKGTSPQNPSNFKLGSTFAEKSDIRNLQPFEGDTLIEGRWGQTIRFGSTVKGSSTKNPWSSGDSKNGDPIIIIRNGQGVQGPEPAWVNTVEDINTDGASIYLCAGQAIFIQDLNSFKLDSFSEGAKATEDQTQELRRTPSTTDTISAQKQSQYQLTQATRTNK